MNIDYKKRGTGRTHNMIVAAIAHARECGESVVVMADGKDMTCSLNHFTNTEAFDDLRRECEVKVVRIGQNAKIVVRNPRTDEVCTISFVSSKMTNIEWYQFRVIGVSEKATFFDHHAVELHFAEVLDRWTRYDNKLSNLNAAHAQRYIDEQAN